VLRLPGALAPAPEPQAALTRRPSAACSVPFQTHAGTEGEHDRPSMGRQLLQRAASASFCWSASPASPLFKPSKKKGPLFPAYERLTTSFLALLLPAPHEAVLESPTEREHLVRGAGWTAQWPAGRRLFAVAAADGGPATRTTPWWSFDREPVERQRGPGRLYVEDQVDDAARRPLPHAARPTPRSRNPVALGSPLDFSFGGQHPMFMFAIALSVGISRGGSWSSIAIAPTLLAVTAAGRQRVPGAGSPGMEPQAPHPRFCLWPGVLGFCA